MAPVQCPQGLNPTNGTCFGLCPAGSQVQATDPSVCISTIACQVGTVADLAGLACTKTDIVPKVGTCPVGYTEWQTGLCYINCNPYFIENGLNCVRNLTTRASAAGWCSSFFFTIQGNSCVFNVPLFLILFVGFVCLIWFLVLVGIGVSRLKPRSIWDR